MKIEVLYEPATPLLDKHTNDSVLSAGEDFSYQMKISVPAMGDFPISN